MSQQIDARGPRFGAAITAIVFALALVAGPGALGIALVVLQVVAHGLGAFFGLSKQPYGFIYARLVRPRLAGPTPLEDAAPPRFAQAVGFGFATVALLGALTGLSLVFQVAVAAALAAAFLNAAFAFCLGCEMYLLIRRVRTV